MVGIPESALLTPVLGGMTLTKEFKLKKPTPPYWRIIQLLRKLRVKHKERNKGELSFHITIDEFGIVLKFNNRITLNQYNGWDEIFVDLDKYQLNPLVFGRDLMWLLISKGYMAYLRGPETGNSMIWRHFLIKEGWGLKIIDKRLQLYNNEPKHKFMIDHNTRLRKMSISYILTYYPDFFDYLW